MSIMVAEAWESNPVSPGYEPGMVIRSTRQQWYLKLESNQYPPQYERGAPPTELFRQIQDVSSKMLDLNQLHIV